MYKSINKYRTWRALSKVVEKDTEKAKIYFKLK